MVRVAIVTLLLVVWGSACSRFRELNPSYCANHREDPDCLTTGVDLIDAPATPECTTDADCPDAKLPACDPVNQRCVMCIAGSNTSACGPTESCGMDQKCHGCLTDGDCPLSGVCKSDQSCAMMDEVRYAIPGGTGDCSRSSACSFEIAVEGVSAQQHIIKLLKGTSDTFNEPPISIDEEFPVQIIGKGVTFKPAGSGDAITVVGGGGVEIFGLSIVDVNGKGFKCTDTPLTLQQVTMTNISDRCFETTNCNVRMTRSSISRCGSLAMVVTGGMHEIRNNFFSDLVANADGTVLFTQSSGRFVFNTMVRITSDPGAQKVAGVGCTGTMTVAQNVIVQYGAAGRIVQGCTNRENIPSQNFGGVGFVSTTDFHLTGTSTVTGILDGANTMAADTDCLNPDGSGKIEDFDGVTRPYNFYCDRGADEYQP